MANIKTFNQPKVSCGLLQIAERHSSSVLDQRFLTALGTCCKVGMNVFKMTVRVGRVDLTEVDDMSGEVSLIRLTLAGASLELVWSLMELLWSVVGRCGRRI